MPGLENFFCPQPVFNPARSIRRQILAFEQHQAGLNQYIISYFEYGKLCYHIKQMDENKRPPLKLSTSHQRKLIMLYKFIKSYPKFKRFMWHLMSFFKDLPKLRQVVKISEYATFWKKNN